MDRSTIFQTDQNRCFDPNGRPIPCRDSGQDGELRCGRPWPIPRFRVHDEVVEDKLTGLSWPRHAAPSEFPLTWREAQAFAEALNAENFLGRNDWRLPQRRELFSLISHAAFNPALPKLHPFISVFNGYYWSATPCNRLPQQAWYVHMGGGRVFKGMQHGSYMVWPVSAKPKPPEDDMALPVRGGDEIIDDRRSGLMWTCNADLTAGRIHWQGALDAVRKLNSTCAWGYNDWRLPNVRELESLVNIQRHSPAITEPRLFRDIRDGYWSSTTSAYDPSYAWVLYTEDGNVGVGYKARPTFYAWAARSRSDAAGS